MERIFTKTLLASALAMVIAPAAYATNGMAPIGVGQIQKAMGGAAVANPENTMTMGTNPASASFIDDGFDLGMEVFVPTREADFGAALGGVYDGNDTKAFLVPEGGYKRTLDNGLALGVVVYGNGGMNTDYEPSFPNPMAPPGTTAAGINFMQVFISPTISKKINDNHSVGISANLVAQAFRSQGILGASATDTDTATGIGATVGYMGKISPTAMIGLSHRFKTKMSGFDENAPLFMGATGGTVTDGKMDVPGATTIGLSFDVTPKTKVAVDLQRIYYSNVKAIHDGFKWEDQDVVKLGVKHQLNDKVALLGGLNFGESVVNPLNAGFNILAPAVTESHLSLGTEIALTKKSSMSVVYMHAFENTVEGPIGGGNSVALKMHQDSIGVGYSRKF